MFLDNLEILDYLENPEIILPLPIQQEFFTEHALIERSLALQLHGIGTAATRHPIQTQLPVLGLEVGIFTDFRLGDAEMGSQHVSGFLPGSDDGTT